MKPIEEIESAIMKGVELAQADGKKIVDCSYLSEDHKCMCPLTALYLYVNGGHIPLMDDEDTIIVPRVRRSFDEFAGADVSVGASIGASSLFIDGFDGNYTMEPLNMLGKRIRHKLLDVSQ